MVGGELIKNFSHFLLDVRGTIDQGGELKHLGSQMVDYGLKFFFKGTYAHGTFTSDNGVH